MRRAVLASLPVVGVLTALGTAAAGPSSAHQPFINGNVTAVSQAMQVAPKTGGFAYTMTVGTSIADYRDTLAQASSQSLDMGLIGTALTTQQCNGSAPVLKPNQLPQPLVAESDHGTQRRSATTGPAAKSGVLASAGQESVEATTTPSAAASFTGGSLAIPGVLSIGGFASSDSARLVDHVREAISTAEVHQLALAGGKVVFDDLTWTASQISGARAAATGSFHVGSLTVAGNKQRPTAANLGAAVDAANKAIAATGLHVTLPTATRHGQQVVVSPLSIGMDDSKVGAELVSPVLQAAQPVTDAVTNALLGVTCQAGSPLTVADLAVGTADGTGSTDLLFGGASVGTQLIASTDPFGTPTLGSPAGSPAATGGIGPSGRTGPGGSGSVTAPRAGGTANASGAGTSGQQPVTAAPASATSESCSTTSTAGWPSCSNGNALAVALIALGVLTAMGAADYLTLRRRRLPDVSL